jgi:hypothetical protein
MLYNYIYHSLQEMIKKKRKDGHLDNVIINEHRNKNVFCKIMLGCKISCVRITSLIF